jgi:uncharacterized membrane protein
VTKDKPTPSRKEAEAARKKALKPAVTRKEQAERDRAARKRIRELRQEGLRTGEDKFLPLRDRGPIKRFARDYLDRRRLVAEFLLPILLIAFVLSIFPKFAAIGTLAWVFTTIVAVVEMVFVIRSLKKEIARRFPGESVKGVTLYTILRATQMRRFRLPAAQVKRFEQLPEKY